MVPTISMLTSLSSATSTVRPASGRSSAARGGGVAAGASGGSTSSAQNTLPPPLRGCMPTPQPMRSASSRQIDSPSPVPP